MASNGVQAAITWMTGLTLTDWRMRLFTRADRRIFWMEFGFSGIP